MTTLGPRGAVSQVPRPRYKVAGPGGVHVGDSPSEARSGYEAGAAPTPGFAGSAAGELTWLANRWWTWTGSAWTPIARASSGGSRWGEPLPLSPALVTWTTAELTRSGAEPLAVRMSDGGLYLIAAERGAPALRSLSGEPPSLDALPPPPVPVEVAPFVDVHDSMRKCAKQIAHDFRRRRVVELAHKIVRDANIPSPRGRPDREAIMWALFAYLKANTTFHDDPHDTELTGSTEAILCLDPDGACLAGGDCDDMIVALCALALALGIPVRLRARRYANQKQLHVVVEYDAARRGDSQWRAIDPSLESGKASDAAYVEEIFQTIDTQPTFVGLGDAPMLGDTTTATANPAQQLDPATQAAWIAMLRSAQAQFQQSMNDLQTVSSEYLQVRTLLGLGLTDDASTATGETTASSTPIADYVASVAAGNPKWTTAAEQDEVKILSTAAFINEALTEALAGTRTLTFDPTGGLEGGKPDLFIGYEPGDPYSVLLVKNPQTGVYSPEYFQPGTSTPLASGATLGAWTVLEVVVVTVGVAAVSLAVTWAVTHYMDSVRAAHADDMLGKVTENQQQLIQEGKLTPAQALEQTQALTAAATALNPPQTPATTSLATIAQWLAIAAVAVAGVFVVRSVVMAMPPRRPLEAEDSASAYRGWERRRERDDFTEQNIEPELLPLWHRVRGQFRGSPHERFEAFMEYAETDEGQREATAAQVEDSEGGIDELLGERQEQGCKCNDTTGPRCCGRGCCSYHRGIARRRRRAVR